jgi:hypothetical protein
MYLLIIDVNSKMIVKAIGVVSESKMLSLPKKRSKSANKYGYKMPYITNADDVIKIIYNFTEVTLPVEIVIKSTKLIVKKYILVN